MIEAVTTSPLFGIVLCIGVLLIFDIPYEDFAIGGDIVNMMSSLKSMSLNRKQVS